MFPLRTHWSSASSLTASIQLPSTDRHLHHTITNITPSPISHHHQYHTVTISHHHYHTITIITPSPSPLSHHLVKKSIKYFDDAIQRYVMAYWYTPHLPPPPSSTSTGPPPLLAVLGKARFYISRYNFKAAMDVLQRSVSTNPAFLPGLIEKMRVELANQQWDSATETANR